jgi:hypothetical protein
MVVWRGYMYITEQFPCRNNAFLGPDETLVLGRDRLNLLNATSGDPYICYWTNIK